MKRKALLAATLALAIAGVALATLTLTASGAGPAMNRASTTCNKLHPFSTYWNRKQVDPIVAYGQTSAHMHDFFGRGGTTPALGGVSSTMGAPLPITPGHEDDPGYTPIATNCTFYSDWASYWFPVAKMNGVDLLPGVETNTYQAPVGVQVATPPFGMNFVAGNASATSTDAHVAFTCGDIDDTHAAPIDCTGIGIVTAQVTFPDCWDGKVGYTYPPGGLAGQSFDSPTGLLPSHFSYSVNGACPVGMIPCTPGTRIAQLVTQETWLKPDGTPLVNPLNPDGSVALSFSSGAYYTFHGDYINTWNMAYLGGIVNQCLNHGTPGSCPFGTQVGLHQLA